MDTGPRKNAKPPSKDERYANVPLYGDPLIDLFTSGRGSDCIIKCKDREWKLHTIILSSRSSFFSALFDGYFMESSSREVNLDDNDPEALEVILRHLYVRLESYRPRSSSAIEFSQNAQFDINVAITADQLGVLDLAEQAAEYLKGEIGWELWEDELYADTMVEIAIAAIFGKPVCAALEAVEIVIVVSVAAAFRGCNGPLDRINRLLCQYPILNRQVLEEFVRNEMEINASTPPGLRGW